MSRPERAGEDLLVRPGAVSADRFAAIDRAALWALRLELSLYPKAGLVSFVDSGSHRDMDAGTFLRSIAALDGYFGAMARSGADGSDFAALNRLGRTAEAAMFSATQGVNTHRGAVFSLGLLAAAAGACASHASPEDICAGVQQRWAVAIQAAGTVQEQSHGAAVRARYGVRGAREEAAHGFPTLCRHVLPAFRSAQRGGGDLRDTALNAFYAAVAVAEDNNLLHRRGPEGLELAQRLAGRFLAGGGMLADDGTARAEEMHRRFVAENLSPGGSADLIAAALFLLAVSGEVAWA